MRKNKGLFLVLVTLLAVTCLLVSCNSEVTSKAEAGEGKLVYATFGNGSKATRPTGSTMTQSYSVDGINDVYWVYTATKDDAYGTHGQQTSYVRVNETKGLAGAIGPFSKGYWNFSLKGYKYVGSGTDDTTATTDFSGSDYRLVFVGSVSHFLLSDDNTASTATPISVTVYLQTDGGAGTLTVSNNFKFFWADDATTSSGALKLKVYLDDSSSETISADLAYNAATTSSASNAYYSLPNAVSNSNVAAGDHSLKAKVVRVIDEADMVYFEGTLPVKIYSGQQTVVDMNLLEGKFVYGQFDGTVDLSSVVVATSVTGTFESNTAKFESSYTPASNGTAETGSNAKKTTVVFSNATGQSAVAPYSGSENNTSYQYDLGVTVSNVEASASKFVVTSDNIERTAVAAIDLTLTKTTIVNNQATTSSTVSEFAGQIATVTTYIAKGLEDVKVFYNESELGAVTDAPSSLQTTDAGNYTYDSATGKLTIYTAHFSEFYVASSNEAYIVETGTAYKLNEAINAAYSANKGYTVKLLRDVEITSAYEKPNALKNTILDGCNKTVTVNADGKRGWAGNEAYGDVTIKNLTVKAGTDDNSGIAYNYSVIYMDYSNSLIFDNCTIGESGRTLKFSGNNVGGFVSFPWGKSLTFLDCSNYYNLVIDNAENGIGVFVGGYFAANNQQRAITLRMINCQNFGNITAGHVGYLTGNNQSMEYLSILEMTNCTNAGYFVGYQTAGFTARKNGAAGTALNNQYNSILQGYIISSSGTVSKYAFEYVSYVSYTDSNSGHGSLQLAVRTDESEQLNENPTQLKVYDLSSYNASKSASLTINDLTSQDRTGHYNYAIISDCIIISPVNNGWYTVNANGYNATIYRVSLDSNSNVISVSQV